MFDENPEYVPGALGGQVSGEFGAHGCWER
jgi:hypothetical protein